MAESASATGFDPQREFPNIVWNFDNIAEPSGAAPAAAASGSEPGSDAEITGEGLITAPPTPSGPAAIVGATEAHSAVKHASSAKAKSTPAKRKATSSADGSSRKKVKTPKSQAQQEVNKKTEKDLVAPLIVEEKIQAKMAKSRARRDKKRDRRRQKRNGLLATKA